MRKILTLFVALGVGASGCDRFDAADKEAQAAAETETQAPRATDQYDLKQPTNIQEIPVVDRFALKDGSAVTDIAFWSHPTLAFSSTVLVGTEQSFSAFAIERGTLTGEINQRVDSFDVIYPDNSNLVVSVDGETGTLTTFKLDPIDQSIAVVRYQQEEQFSSATALCMATVFPANSSRENLDAIGFMLTPESIISIQILDYPDFQVEVSESVPNTNQLTDCAIEPSTLEPVFLSSNGDIYSDPNGSPITTTQGAAFLGIVAKTNTSDELPENSIIVLSNDQGVVFFLDATTGAALGAVTFAKSFDFDPVTLTQAMGVGYGNYGAVYRDGAIALSSTVDGVSGVNLIPFNAVADRLGFELGGQVDPRRPMTDAEEAFTIEISPTQP